MAGSQVRPDSRQSVVVEHPTVAVPRDGVKSVRTLRASAWDTVFTIGPAVLARLPFRPRQVRASRSQIILSDDHGLAAAFDHSGRLVWSAKAGISGYVADAQLGGDSLWLVLRGAPTATAVQPGGATGRTIHFARTGALTGIVPLRSGGFVVCQYAEVPPCVAAGADGSAGGAVRMPWSDFARLHPLARTATIGRDVASDRWVYAFMQGDGWFAYDGVTPMPYIGVNVEFRKFPDVISDSGRGRITSELAAFDFSVLAGAISDSVVTLLYRSKDGNRYLDRYDFRTGVYRSSSRVDPHTFGLAMANDTCYLLVGSPTRLVALRERRARSSSKPTALSKPDT
jgi:hypothetical protein